MKVLEHHIFNTREIDTEDKYPFIKEVWGGGVFMVNDHYTVFTFDLYLTDKGWYVKLPTYSYGNTVTHFSSLRPVPEELVKLIL